MSGLVQRQTWLIQSNHLHRLLVQLASARCHSVGSNSNARKKAAIAQSVPNRLIKQEIKGKIIGSVSIATESVPNRLKKQEIKGKNIGSVSIGTESVPNHLKKQEIKGKNISSTSITTESVPNRPEKQEIKGKSIDSPSIATECLKKQKIKVNGSANPKQEKTEKKNDSTSHNLNQLNIMEQAVHIESTTPHLVIGERASLSKSLGMLFSEKYETRGISREAFNAAFLCRGVVRKGEKRWTCKFTCPLTGEVRECGTRDSVGPSLEIDGDIYYHNHALARQAIAEIQLYSMTRQVMVEKQLQKDAELNMTPNPIMKRLRENEKSQQKAIIERGERLDKIIASKQMSAKTRTKFLKAVQLLQAKLTEIVSEKLPGTRFEICGSCVTGLFSEESDVDLSIHIPKSQLPSKKPVVNVIKGIIRKSLMFKSLVSIPQAKIPVLKGCYVSKENPTKNGTLSFDICVANDMAVFNSQLLRDYAMVDERTKSVMMAVNTWAKENGVSAAANGHLSTYGWTNMTIFYLQHIGLLPNLQCPELMRTTGIDSKSDDPSSRIDGLKTLFVPLGMLKSVGWEMTKTLNNLPVSVLLHGFFHFYAYEFPRDEYVVSIRVGNISQPKSAYAKAKSGFFCIEDPFRTFSSPRAHDLCRAVQPKEHENQIIQCVLDKEANLRHSLLGEENSAS